MYMSIYLINNLSIFKLPSCKSFQACFCLHVDRLEHSWAGQLEHGCWQACPCNVGTYCSWLDERTDLNDVVRTIMINQQQCSCMIEHAVREWWNNKIEQRCYNNHELGCCIKSGFSCSNIREQPLSIRQAVYNMLKHDWTL